MESNIKSSFIPPTPLAPVRNSMPRSSGGGFDLFVLLAVVLFVASATLAAGVFLYAQYLNSSATSKLEQLERAKQAFEPALINDLTRLDTRMRTADVILGSHIAPTALFTLLQQLTLQTVAFSSFDFSLAEDAFTLTMKGNAQSVNSVALQADLLSKSGIISNPIFSNIARQREGVDFDFTADVHPEALNYARQLNPVDTSRLDMPQAAPEAPASPFGTPGEAQAPAGGASQTQQGTAGSGSATSTSQSQTDAASQP